MKDVFVGIDNALAFSEACDNIGHRDGADGEKDFMTIEQLGDVYKGKDNGKS